MHIRCVLLSDACVRFAGKKVAGQRRSIGPDQIVITTGKIGMLDMMLKAGLIASKGEGRRLVQQGGVSINNEKITDPNYSLTTDAFGEEIILKKGKKVYNKYVMA